MRTIRNNSRLHILNGLKTAAREIPFDMTELGFDNGSNFLYEPVVSGPASVEAISAGG